MSQSLNKLYKNGVLLQKKIHDAHEKNEFNFNDEGELFYNNQKINLLQYEITELHLEQHLIRIDSILIKNPDIRTLQNITEIYAISMEKYKNLLKSLNNMLILIDKEAVIVNNVKFKNEFLELKNHIKSKIIIIDKQTKLLQTALSDYQQQLKKQLAVRQSLSEYKVSSWPVIAGQLALVPSQLLTYLNKIFVKTLESFVWLSVFTKILLICLVILLC
jgi:potassium efflux system protein